MILKPIPFEADRIPDGFQIVVWRGDGEHVADAAGVMRWPLTIFRLELDDESRRQLIEGNPVYLAMVGHVVPFAVSVNLREMAELC